jgi:hypothetical protein
MRAYSFLLILSLSFLFGCNSDLEGLVRGGGDRVPESQVATPPLFNSGPGYRISSGANVVAGSQMKSQFVLAPTLRTISGAKYKSVFSFHSTQTE